MTYETPPKQMRFKIRWYGKHSQGIFLAETPSLASTQIQEAQGFGADKITIFFDGREITDLDFAMLLAAEATDRPE